MDENLKDWETAGKNINRVWWKFLRRVVLIIVVLLALFLGRKAIAAYIEELRIRIEESAKDKEEKKPFSLELVDEEMDNSNYISIDAISASSTLYTSDGVEYGTEYLLDDDLSTSWQEGQEDYGEGDCLDICFTYDRDLQYIEIYNGNQADESTYYANNRLEVVTITIGDHSEEIYLEDTMGPQVIKVNNAGSVSGFRIQIESVYYGNEWDDTCVSEIVCYE